MTWLSDMPALALVAGVLKAYPDVTGILFDLPEVIATAHEALDVAGVQDRCSTVGGSFFTEVPPRRGHLRTEVDPS
jgi:hypothetical protein